MPNIKAAVKWVRQSEKRKLRNLDTKSRLRTLFKKAKNETTDVAIARDVESAFDKAVSKGIIHKNKAARKKSRLAKAISAGPETKASGPTKRAKKAPARKAKK